MSSRGWLRSAPFLFAVLIAGCGDSAPSRVTEAQQDQVIWQALRTWSGNGDAQLDSFTSDTGALRIEWEATAKTEAASARSFRIAVHSSISGRPLTVPVDQRGSGRGSVFVSEEPRVFFMVVTGEDFDWKIAVAERLR